MFCTSCGKQLPDGTQFCVHCGAKQNAVQAPRQNAQTQGAPAPQQAAYAPVQQPRKSSKAPLVIIVASVVIIVACVVIAGIYTNWFGLASPASSASSSSTATASKSSADASSESAAASSASDTSSASAASSASAQSSTAGATPPKFASTTASSVCKSDDVDSYVPGQAVDGNTRTAWVTDGEASHDASGQWIELSASDAQHVTGVKIMPGFCKSEEVLTKNRCPKDITVTFSDGSTYKTTLTRKYNDYQTVNFPSAVNTSSIRITINSSYAPTYDGKRYDDCGISEIQAF